MHAPRKRFGQNFLRDGNVVTRIVRAINPQPGQHLVEIGPGQAALTRPLLETGCHLEVVELDRDLVPALQALPGLTVHEADALKFDFCSLAQAGEQLRVVGNLPYNISTPLLFHLIEQAACIQDMTFMLQREVVDRMTAAPASEAYGRLSVMVQFHCQAERLFTVPPGAFFPPPKVESAIVHLVPHPQPPVVVADEALFARLVAQAFSQRRKTLRNTLKGWVAAEAMASVEIDPQRRAETLTLAEFARLAALVEPQ